MLLAAGGEEIRLLCPLFSVCYRNKRDTRVKGDRMATVIEDPEFREKILSAIRTREFSDRSGIHGSDLIYCLNKSVYRKLYPSDPSDTRVLLFSIGWATQRWLTGKDEDIPSITKDGISITPDELYEGCPWELKATYGSSSRPIENELAWMRQIMGQCVVTGKREARLSRFEIMGDWKWVFSKDPVIKANSKHPSLSAVHVTFTQDELDRFWAWMKERRNILTQMLEEKAFVPKILAVASGQEWECDSCEYADICDKIISNGGQIESLH
jgi:hypothetical protein